VGLDETEADDDEEPPLPAGLGDDELSDEAEPALPSGIEASDAPDALSAADATDAAEADGSSLSPLLFHGFVDARAGTRLVEADHASRASLGEARLQLSLSGEWSWIGFGATADVLYDPVLNEHAVDLELGHGFVDARELYLVLSPSDAVDLKLGRQAMTWGTGDLVFINDLFPKDWTAFIVGRDIEYLRAPSDAARLSMALDPVELDLVFSPRHDADRFPDRRRLVSYDPSLGRLAGDDAVPRVQERDRWFRDIEVALRQRLTVGSWELALYGYHGFYKSPAGVHFGNPSDPATAQATFPRLAAYGASVRGPLFGGIVYAEGGHYLSLDDPEGDDPLVQNGEVRALLGYEHVLAQDVTLSGQYYLEWMLEHGDYLGALPPTVPAANETRHVVTTRLSWNLLRQTLRASLFVFFSPSDVDTHLRPHLQYAIDDTWRVETGAAIFMGKDDHTFFGQLEDNSNAWAAVRASW
jgi:hypothetical protein